MSMSDLIRSDSLERLPVSGSVRIDRTIMSPGIPPRTQEQIEAARSRLTVIGYSSPDWGYKIFGQVTIEETDNYFDGYMEHLHSHFSLHNKLSIFPLLNIYTAIDKIVKGIIYSHENQRCSNHFVIQEDIFKYRAILIITGLSELTLVGGWLLHGGMTLYYYSHTNGNA
jgi:hypothetical protein